MSGKRQHYVPRLLQRGFLHDPEEEAQRTWLHRRRAKASLVGIRDVGVEDWFYSRKSLDGQPTLDDLIQGLEEQFGLIVDDMRRASTGDLVDADTAARCVVHLAMRTSHIRHLVSEGLRSTVNEMHSLFTDQRRLANALGLNAPELSQSTADAIRNASKIAAYGCPPSLSEQVLSVLIRENPEDVARYAASHVAPVFPLILGKLASKVRDAHNNVLEIAQQGMLG